MHENFKNSHTNSNVTKTAIVRPLMLMVSYRIHVYAIMEWLQLLKHISRMNVIASRSMHNVLVQDGKGNF